MKLEKVLQIAERITGGDAVAVHAGLWNKSHSSNNEIRICWFSQGEKTHNDGGCRSVSGKTAPEAIAKFKAEHAKAEAERTASNV
jgi:hypothetical protein